MRACVCQGYIPDTAFCLQANNGNVDIVKESNEQWHVRLLDRTLAHTRLGEYRAPSLAANAAAAAMDVDL